MSTTPTSSPDDMTPTPIAATPAAPTEPPAQGPAAPQATEAPHTDLHTDTEPEGPVTVSALV